jgi:exopolysaccharide biosynthesis polyprenyl glycosylphosphotransferase
MSVIDHALVSENGRRLAARASVSWTRGYLRWSALTDVACALLAGGLALYARFAGPGQLPVSYVAFAIALPVFWCGSVALAGGYAARIIGAGSDEFRRVLNAAIGLAAAVAVASYALKIDFARGYFVIALPSVAVFDLAGRYRLRKRLHRLRSQGACMQRVVAVGHAPAVADLVATLRRDKYNGLSVVGICLAGPARLDAIAGVPVLGGLGSVSAAVSQVGADTVAVLACPEINGIRLRDLAWELEERGTDLCVAPALMDVAGPRTAIRPVAGLPLLQLDHPELAGGKQVIKAAFDKLAAGLALFTLAPLFAAIALAIRLDDGGPVFFTQTRVGRDGRTFRLFKFRTMVVDAEQRKAQLATLNEASGVLFKMHRDPRVTNAGAALRRWSLDELPQLFNVLAGDMSLVGPRPALPSEVARYGSHMRRRLVVKPGLTGLWQVSGRSGLSWEESFRLDLRYVDNWSIVLDLQILWKTCSAVIRGQGACLALAARGPRPRGPRCCAPATSAAVALPGGRSADHVRGLRSRHGALVHLAAPAAAAAPRRCDRDAERARRPPGHGARPGLGAPGPRDRHLPRLCLLGARHRLRAEDTRGHGGLLRPQPADHARRGRVRRPPGGPPPLALDRRGDRGSAGHRGRAGGGPLPQREHLRGQRPAAARGMAVPDRLPMGLGAQGAPRSAELLALRERSAFSAMSRPSDTTRASAGSRSG